MTSVKSGGLPSRGRKKEVKRRNKIYLELFHHRLRDPQADLAQVSVPPGSLKDTEGTPGYDFPKETVSQDRYLPWPLAQLPLVTWTNAQNSHRRHVVVSIDTGRAGHGVSWYPRATTATRRSQGSEKAQAPPSFNAHHYFLFSDFPC